MGYYTEHELVRVEGCDEDVFVAALTEVAGYGELFADAIKWYNHENHIVAAMQRTGATLVEIHGDGEEQGDVWDKVFKYSEDDRAIFVEEYRYTLNRSAGCHRTRYAVDPR